MEGRVEEEKANCSELQPPAKCLCEFGVGGGGSEFKEKVPRGHLSGDKQVIRSTLAT